MRYGVHVSIAGGLAKAAERGRALRCTALQIFARNPRGWKAAPLSPSDAAAFAGSMESGAVERVVIHAPYLVNLASPDASIRERSIGAVVGDLRRCRPLGASFVVTHIGSHMGRGEEYGLRRVASAITRIFGEYRGRAMLLLENTAGGGDTVGHSFRQLGRIFKQCGSPSRLGLCFDTAHAHAAGYDLRSERGFSSMLGEAEDYVGIDRLEVIHFNDSKGERGSRLDRHEHLCRGKIGRGGLSRVAACRAFADLTFILETPKDTQDADVKNLRVLKKMLNVERGVVLFTSQVNRHELSD